MKKSIKLLNMVELIFGLLVFTILRQFSSNEVQIVFMVPVIFLLSLPSGRFQQSLLTKKNIFDMIYGFLGTLVILLIVFKTPDITNVIPTGETVSIGYLIGSMDISIEYLTIINTRATSIPVILFFTIIPAISIGYTIISDIAKNGFNNSRRTEKKKNRNFFENE